MKRYIKTLAGCGLIFLFGIAIGYVLRTPIPQGGAGRDQESPDKKWRASAATMEVGTIYGTTHTYYEFVVQPATPARNGVRNLKIEDNMERPIDWREEGSIKWETNSSAVTFQCDANERSLQVTLKTEQ